jgi:hypothetical protein
MLANLGGTNYTDNNAVSGTTYYYVVSALDQFGESSNSTQIAASLFTNHPPLIINGIRLIGVKLMVNGSGGTASGNYVALASTNVALPLTGWQRIATNSFDAGGNFSFTNSTNPGAPQTFYQLLLQ